MNKVYKGQWLKATLSKDFGGYILETSFRKMPIGIFKSALSAISYGIELVDNLK